MAGRLRITVLDLVGKGPSRAIWQRIMVPNFASIMPQVIGVWCEELGHTVRVECYTGAEDLRAILSEDTDVLFLAAFTHSAQFASAVSNFARHRGIVTVLGGPHARSYPEDARRHFDYVLGFTDKTIVEEVLREREPRRVLGRRLSAKGQPAYLPGVKERWKFIQQTLAKAPGIKIIPMIGSLGCPYTCSFCVDSTVAFQPMGYDQIREDLRFLLATVKRPRVGWHDPNFGMRFDKTMDAIEEVVPPGRIDFAAESSLSLLSEKHLKRFQSNGFKAILPGIESWYSCNDKSKSGRSTGMDKVKQVSEHVNLILRYIPYLQANFVLGLDEDEGAEPFELTKRFLDRSPGAFPGYSFLTTFGESAPLDRELQQQGRVLPVPFHFLNNNRATNVRSRNYTMASLYDHVIDLRRYSFSPRAVARRLRANRGTLTRGLNFVRAVSSEGAGRVRYDRSLRAQLRNGSGLREFLDGKSGTLPAFFRDQIRSDLGPMWEWLPPGALSHDVDTSPGRHAERAESDGMQSTVGLDRLGFSSARES
ncbi:MAG TPA: radical SAM protein [bacterium]|nr:radical SAM protein [bacterium]